MSTREHSAAQRMEKDIRTLAESIGVRAYASVGERQAAEFVAKRMRQVGLTHIRHEEFPVTAFRNGRASCQIMERGRWREVACLPGNNTPPTPKQGIEGELVLIEDVTKLRQHGDLHGRIALLMGGFLQTSAVFRQLMNSGLKGIIYVDHRFPNDWAVDVGIPAVWFKYATLPLVCIPYTEAWRITEKGFPKARIMVGIERFRGQSQNVIGELPGKSEEVIVVSAHHDTTPHCAAPDDDAVGVAAMLELARVASCEGQPRRTMRFISFGAEEVLSEGARQHVMRLKRNGEANRVRFVLNNDSIGSRLGNTTLWVWGPESMADWARRELNKADIPVGMTRELCPFSDHFPFNAIGVPSFWFHRTNTAAGRFYHHSQYDTMSVISVQKTATLVALQARLLHRIANARALPWKGSLSEEQNTGLRKAARDLLGFKGTGAPEKG